jgi:N-methylhydantoinase A
VADKKVDQGLTRVLRLAEATPSDIAAIFTVLEAKVTAEARKMDRFGPIRLQRSASMRYAGQGYELRVDLPDGAIEGDYVERTLAAFHTAYKREYGYNDPLSPVEVSDWFAVATIPGSRDRAGIRLRNDTEGGDPVVGERLAYFPEAGGMTPTKVVNRYALTEGHRIAGPALVEERESTAVVLPGDVVSVSAAGNLVIDIRAGG